MFPSATLGLLRNFVRNGLGAPALMVVILMMVVIPLPPMALDLFFTFNIALALVVLLVSVYTLKPLEFAIFPTVLLVATLMRLALNIASTRIVLLEGHQGGDAAGRVIEAFGGFVVGGNYAVGLVVFAILVIINFVVVTKGAGRVSEVSARFTLDALPGKQMAIDADLNAGILTQDEARDRRSEIAQEADFYGAMDGASKFVRGDAVAGILILVINIVGGLAVGMTQHGLTLGIAVEYYSLLTIGDGLVAQIPSLLLSTAAAMMVTRASRSADVGQQVLAQLFGSARALGLTGAIIGLMGLIPGMPNLPFLVLATGCGVLAYRISRRDVASTEAEPETLVEDDTTGAPEEVRWEDLPEVDTLGLEVGYRLIPLVDQNQGGQLLSRIRGVRKKISRELGFLVPPVHIRDNLDLPPAGYRLSVRGVVVAEAEIFPDREMAIDPGHVRTGIPGIKGQDPAFGLDAVWIESDQRERAQTLGYTVVDCSTVIATHLSQILSNRAHELVGYDEVQRLVERLKESAPKLVEDLVPGTVPMRVVLKVLQNLLREQVPVRDMRTIAETLAERGADSQDPDALTAAARIALRGTIVQKISGLQNDLAVAILAPSLEQLLLKTVQAESGGQLPVEPGLAERLQTSLGEVVQANQATAQIPVLLVADNIRSSLANFARTSVPELRILGFSEVPEDKQLRIVANVGS